MVCVINLKNPVAETVCTQELTSYAKPMPVIQISALVALQENLNNSGDFGVSIQLTQGNNGNSFVNTKNDPAAFNPASGIFAEEILVKISPEKLEDKIQLVESLPQTNNNQIVIQFSEGTSDQTGHSSSGGIFGDQPIMSFRNSNSSTKNRTYSKTYEFKEMSAINSSDSKELITNYYFPEWKRSNDVSIIQSSNIPIITSGLWLINKEYAEKISSFKFKISITVNLGFETVELGSLSLPNFEANTIIEVVFNEEAVNKKTVKKSGKKAKEVVN